MNKYECIENEKSLSDISYDLDIKEEFEIKEHFDSELKTSHSHYPFSIKDHQFNPFEFKSEPQAIKENTTICDLSKTSKAISKEKFNTNNKNSSLKKNINKNSLKLFGNLFIKYFLGLKFKNNTIIEKILQQYEKSINDKSNFSIYTEFREWVKNEGVVYFQNFEAFSLLSKHCIEDKLDDDEPTQNMQATFEKILHKLFKYFLETEIYECMIYEGSKEKKNKDYLKIKSNQLSLIPKLLKGLCDPKGIKKLGGNFKDHNIEINLKYINEKDNENSIINNKKKMKPLEKKRRTRTKIVKSIKKKRIKKKLPKKSDPLNLNFNFDSKVKSKLLFNNLNSLLFDSSSFFESSIDGYEEVENSKTLEEKQELCSDRTKQNIYSKRINMNSLLKLLMKAIYIKITARDGFRQKRMIENLCKQNASEFLIWIKENKKYFKVLSKITNLSLFLNGEKKLECTNDIFPKILEKIIRYFLQDEAYSFLIYEKKCEGEEINFLQKLPQLLSEIEKIH